MRPLHTWQTTALALVKSIFKRHCFSMSLSLSLLEVINPCLGAGTAYTGRRKHLRQLGQPSPKPPALPEPAAAAGRSCLHPRAQERAHRQVSTAS